MRAVSAVLIVSVIAVAATGCTASRNVRAPEPSPMPVSTAPTSPELSAATSRPPSDEEPPGRFRTASGTPVAGVIGSTEIVPPGEVADRWNLEWDEADVRSAADVVQRSLAGRAEELYIVSGGTAFWVMGAVDFREVGVAFALFEGAYDDSPRPLTGTPYVDQELAAFFE